MGGRRPLYVRSRAGVVAGKRLFDRRHAMCLLRRPCTTAVAGNPHAMESTAQSATAHSSNTKMLLCRIATGATVPTGGVKSHLFEWNGRRCAPNIGIRRAQRSRDYCSCGSRWSGFPQPTCQPDPRGSRLSAPPIRSDSSLEFKVCLRHDQPMRPKSVFVARSVPGNTAVVDHSGLVFRNRRASQIQGARGSPRQQPAANVTRVAVCLRQPRPSNQPGLNNNPSASHSRKKPDNQTITAPLLLLRPQQASHPSPARCSQSRQPARQQQNPPYRLLRSLARDRSQAWLRGGTAGDDERDSGLLGCWIQYSVTGSKKRNIVNGKQRTSQERTRRQRLWIALYVVLRT